MQSSRADVVAWDEPDPARLSAATNTPVAPRGSLWQTQDLEAR